MSLRDKTHEKMLKEMNEEHTQSEDMIHNWLCNQDDEKLFKGILKEDRSIKGALKFCISNASKVREGNGAMIPDETVFGWVFQYFIKEKVDQVEVNAIVKTSSEVEKPKKEKKKKENKSIKLVKSKTDEQMGGVQLDLLDFL